MNKGSIKTLVIFLTLLVVGVGSYFGYKNIAASKNKPTVRYNTSKVKKSNIEETVQSTGTVFSGNTKDVLSNNSGEIKNLTLKEGDVVKSGDTICIVYDSSIEDQISKSQLALEQQQLQLSKAKTDTDVQNLAVQQAQKDLNNKIAQRDKMTLTAPIGGTITAKSANNGDTLQSGKTILTVTDTSALKINVAIDELDISKIKQGQKAKLTFEALPDKTFEGAVETIAQSGTTSNNVTTYNVVISIASPEGIKLGMNANVNVIVNSKQNVLVVPTEAITEKSGKKYALVPSNESNTQNQSGTAKTQEDTSKKSKPEGTSNQSTKQSSRNIIETANTKLVEIKTGIQNATYIEVVSGLKEGDSVLIALPQSNGTTNKSTNTQQKSFQQGMTGGGNMPSGGGTGGGNRPAEK